MNDKTDDMNMNVFNEYRRTMDDIDKILADLLRDLPPVSPITGSPSVAEAQPFVFTSVPAAEGFVTINQIDQTQRQAQPFQTHKKANNPGGHVFNFMFYLLIAVIIGGSAMFALSNNPGKSYFGFRLYTVKTPSMSPRADGSSPPGGFNAGDTILVKICDPETVQPGDIVTYVPGSDPHIYLTHRVVKILDHLNDDKGIFFVTKGDANDSDDPPISGDMVVGKKVLVIPGTGGFLQFIRDNLILCLLIIISGTGCAVLLRIYFSMSDKNQKYPDF